MPGPGRASPAEKHTEELRRVFALLAERPCPRIGSFNFRSRLPLEGVQGEGQGDLQVQFLPGTLPGIRKILEYLQSPREVTQRLEIGRVFEGTLPGPLPVGLGLGMHASGGVVLRDHFRLRLGYRWELHLQRRRNPLVDLLTCAFEQRLIGSVLEEGVFEHIGGLRREPALTEQRHHLVYNLVKVHPWPSHYGPCQSLSRACTIVPRRYYQVDSRGMQEPMAYGTLWST